VVSKLLHATAGRYLLPMAADILKGFGPAYLNLYASIKHFSSWAEYERLLITQNYAIRRSEDLTFGIVSLIAAAPLFA
jgi:ubiquinone/menaquinone biosynthesis C-methylase UbiE